MDVAVEELVEPGADEQIAAVIGAAGAPGEAEEVETEAAAE